MENADPACRDKIASKPLERERKPDQGVRESVREVGGNEGRRTRANDREH